MAALYTSYMDLFLKKTHVATVVFMQNEQPYLCVIHLKEDIYLINIIILCEALYFYTLNERRLLDNLDKYETYEETTTPLMCS